MGLRLKKVQAEWVAFRQELKTGSKRGFFHDYVDLWVEKNRHMPYTWGHIEAFFYPFLLVSFIAWLLAPPPAEMAQEVVSAWCAMSNCQPVEMP